jgi:hypothetical protein
MAPSRSLAAPSMLVSARVFAPACASAEPIRAPAWSAATDSPSCEAVSGAYADRAVERVASRDGLALQSLGSLMRFHRGDQSPVLLPPYSQTALEWKPPNELHVTLSWPQVDKSFVLPATCVQGGVEVENRDAASVEGFTNHVRLRLRITRTAAGLVVHSTVEKQSTALSIPVSGSAGEAWFRYEPK